MSLRACPSVAAHSRTCTHHVSSSNKCARARARVIERTHAPRVVLRPETLPADEVLETPPLPPRRPAIEKLLDKQDLVLHTLRAARALPRLLHRRLAVVLHLRASSASVARCATESGEAYGERNAQTPSQRRLARWVRRGHTYIWQVLTYIWQVLTYICSVGQARARARRSNGRVVGCYALRCRMKPPLSWRVNTSVLG